MNSLEIGMLVTGIIGMFCGVMALIEDERRYRRSKVPEELQVENRLAGLKLPEGRTYIVKVDRDGVVSATAQSAQDREACPAS